MTRTEMNDQSDVHTCFRITTEEAPDMYLGPYFSLEQAVQASELLQYWIWCGQPIGTITITEWLIREYGLDFVREALKINMESKWNS